MEANEKKRLLSLDETRAQTGDAVKLEQLLDKHEEQMDRQRREGAIRCTDTVASPAFDALVLERRIRRDTEQLTKIRESADAQN